MYPDTPDLAPRSSLDVVVPGGGGRSPTALQVLLGEQRRRVSSRFVCICLPAWTLYLKRCALATPFSSPTRGCLLTPSTQLALRDERPRPASLSNHTRGAPSAIKSADVVVALLIAQRRTCSDFPDSIPVPFCAFGRLHPCMATEPHLGAPRWSCIEARLHQMPDICCRERYLKVAPFEPQLKTALKTNRRGWLTLVLVPYHIGLLTKRM